MGSGEMDKSSKEAKEAKEPKTPNSQAQASTTTAGSVNPDWSGFQAYSPMPPHGFMASSPQAHSYMWGVQVWKFHIWRGSDSRDVLNFLQKSDLTSLM